MEIKIRFVTSKNYSIIINENDTAEELKEKFIQNIFKNIPHNNHVFHLNYGGRILKGKKKLKDYDIYQGCILTFSTVNIGGGYCDNLKKESETPIAKRIGFDFNLIKRNELNINLIHFDSKMTNGENYKYFNDFKIDVVGGFYAMDDINILKKLLKKIEEKNIPFIVVSSGSSGKDIIPICKEYPFIKEVIIFCMNYEYNKHYIEENPGYVKKVTTSIDELYKYLKTFYGYKVCSQCDPKVPYQFQCHEIQMERQVLECPVITKEEYDKCYFLIHKAYAYFFGNFGSKYHYFGDENYEIIKKLLSKLSCIGYIKEEEELILINIFKELKNTKRYDAFVEKTIRKYTGESIFCYLFNRMMRNIESGIIYLSYFMGPLIFELNKYVKNRKECAFSKNMTLYRKLNCSETEFYLYKLNLNHIICFTSLTSTSSKDINFNPTNLAGKINNKGEDSIIVKLIIKYNHEKDNISPGIIVEDKLGKDNDYLSPNYYEKEVILFPFTFAKIVSINSEKKYGKEIKIVNMELINRKTYIEYSLWGKVYEEPKSFCSII